MAPSTGFFFHTKTKPPRKSLQCHSALDFARTGFRPTIRNIAAISRATVMPYDQSMPRISVSPATAGPAMVAMVNSSVLKEMAPDNNSLGTRLGTMACPAGAQKLRPTPNNAAMRNSRNTSDCPVNVNTSSAAAAISSSPYASAMMSRRSKRSAICPPGSSSTTNGRNCARPM